MKRVAFWGPLAMSTAFAATAGAYDMSCVKGADERLIQIVSPGEVGRVCDVRYVRDAGASVLVPYHADNSQAFCEMKADDLVATLTKSGFSCAAAGEAFVEVTAYKGAASPNENSEDVEAPSASPEPAPPEPEQTSASDVQSVDPSLEDKMRAILNEPRASETPQSEAIRGPARLTPGESALPSAGGRADAVGRLLGAAPEETPRAASVTPVGLTIAPPARENAGAPTGNGAASAAKPVKRTPEDVVRATLMAQVAAWNEGDLDAFMETYWKSDDLKFVSGDQVTKGWSSTRKRYRERYRTESGLGWLALEKVDVTMAGENFAVVTGRFHHTSHDDASSGVFSLVMRRTEGVWRIIHDHTSGDPKGAQ